MNKNFNKVNPQFVDPNLSGIKVCSDPDEITRVKQEIQYICGGNKNGFPGGQPVSMRMNDIKLLYEKRYRVSWKADGTRYLMYINGPNRVYMLDRNNSLFCINDLSFPNSKDPNQHLKGTLLDGEFVFDVDPATNQKIPRFLVYDIVKFEDIEVGKDNFDIRMQCIDKEIIFARNEAIKSSRIDKQREPFSVRQKQFFPIKQAKYLLSENFTSQLTHESDGLIFQPVDEPYKCGKCDFILKWKPPTLNSIDFKLIIPPMRNKEEPVQIGYLYLNGCYDPISQITLTETLKQMNNKIIECRWFENRWDFLRERTDKSNANFYKIGLAIWDSIKNPVTEKILLENIEKISTN